MEQGICPGCGRHCDLSNPHCERGAEYLRRGEATQNLHDQEACAPARRDSTTNDKLIDALRDLSRIMRAQYEGRASQKRILMILNETEAITQRELTERLAIQPGSASEILAKLENGGLIVRTPNAEDRRTTDIHLTESGRALAEEAAGQRRQRHEEMFSRLSEAEKETLLSLLETLREDWEARYRGAGDSRRPPEHHHEHHGHPGLHHDHHRRRGGPGWRGRG